MKKVTPPVFLNQSEHSLVPGPVQNQYPNPRFASAGSNSSVKMSERASGSREKEKAGSEGGTSGGGGGASKEAEKRKRSRAAEKLLSSSNPASPGGAKRRRT